MPDTMVPWPNAWYCGCLKLNTDCGSRIAALDWFTIAGEAPLPMEDWFTSVSSEAEPSMLRVKS